MATTGIHSIGGLNIGEAAKLSGVSARMIRHYESLGLLTPAPRTGAGYRKYDTADIHILRFIGRARWLGFSMAEVSEMVQLWRSECCSNKKVERAARKHLRTVTQRVAELAQMRETVQELIRSCDEQRMPSEPRLAEKSGSG